jgi:hypothetical protein
MSSTNCWPYEFRVLAVHDHRFPALAQAVVRVVEEPALTRRVRRENRKRAVGRERALPDFEDHIRNAARLVGDDEEVVRVEALERLRLVRSSRARDGERFFRRIHHPVLVLRLLELQRELRHPLLQDAVPFRKLRPQDVGELVRGGRRARESCKGSSSS